MTETKKIVFAIMIFILVIYVAIIIIIKADVDESVSHANEVITIYEKQDIVDNGGLYRVYDPEFGVVCYVTGNRAGGAFCLIANPIENIK